MDSRKHPFDAYVEQQHDDLRVARAALLFAVDRYPDLPVDAHLQQLDDLTRRVDTCAAKTPDDRIAALRCVLVEQAGFTGCADDYCDPRASYLNEVLSRRHGLPIALSAVWLDVAATLGWPLHGVGLPGHFLIGCPNAQDAGGCYVDPFNAGAVLDRDGCSGLLQRCFGEAVALCDEHLAPVDACAMLTRMLGNLRALYCAAQQWRCAENVLHRLLALHPGAPELCEQVCRVRRRACEQN